jgi:hypothetical protein
MSKPDHAGPPTVTVTVFVPSSVEGKQFTWPQTMKVGEAADAVATACGIDTEAPTFQNAQGEVLDRNKPLVAAGVRDGDELELVSAGGGV